MKIYLMGIHVLKGVVVFFKSSVCHCRIFWIFFYCLTKSLDL